MSLPSALRPGEVPDFAQLHKLEEKRLNAKKKSSQQGRPLTEFKEFRFGTGGNSTKTTEAVKENASSVANTQNRREVSTPQSKPHQLTSLTSRHSMSCTKLPSSQMRRTLPPVPRFNASKEAPAAMVATATTNEQMTASTKQPFTITPLKSITKASRVLTKTPTAAVTTAVVAAVPISFELKNDAETTSLIIDTQIAAPSTANDTSFDFDESELEDEFTCDANSLGSILNQDTWKENDDEEIAATAAMEGMNLSVNESQIRRGTLTGATAANLLTPRAANRGSIYGGAIRTLVKPKTEQSLVRTPAARQTISSGVLPSGMRSMAASRTVMNTPSVAALSSMKSAAQRQATPAKTKQHLPPSGSPTSASSISLTSSSTFASSTTTIPYNTPSKPAKSSLSLHQNYMSPTTSSARQQRGDTPTRTYVAM